MNRTLNIGIRAHDLPKQPLGSLVNDVADRGLGSVQLALNKSFDFDTRPGTLNPGMAHLVGTAFRRRDIQISVLGCYANIIHPDPDERFSALSRFKEHIRYSRDFGCGIVGTETGNVNPDIIYTEENFHEEPFQEVLSSVRELVDEAEKFGVIVGIEPGVNHPIHSPRTMKRLLDETRSNNLQVIFDPVNLLTADNHERQDKILSEAFSLWGDRIAVIHAKDFTIDDGRIVPAPVGKGLMNYKFVLEHLSPHINIILDETSPEHVEDAVRFLNSC
ncbi:sugar phosphate isomerase/epimerase family protein [Halomonas sp. I1]|uniref:sugar phosphate isomerase/epimerase family protein n=1 Tax=Halomonas sp. I1 TaxID=393536 RepID=UPI0028DDA69A|nr:sugar phosphate isomerase/epimerase family protein [Halomonas sp. I1]MDT8895204.1 sugar phosphate isomerase/epimerase family protein [Halomonas sp. I1]